MDLRKLVRIPPDQEVTDALFEFAEQCDADDFASEADMEDAVVKFLKKKHFSVRNQVDCDGKKTTEEKQHVTCSLKGEYRIDIVVRTKNGYYPIELKFNEHSESELEEDVKKIAHYKKHYSDINDGRVFLITNKAESSPWKTELTKSPKNSDYSYVLMESKTEKKEPNAISFKDRWTQKTIKML